MNHSSRLHSGGGGMGGIGDQNPMVFGKSKSQVKMIFDIGITFDDVAGCDGTALELVEVVEFSKQSELYNTNGYIIPRGKISDGSTGIGKVRRILFKLVRIIIYLLIRPRAM